MITQVPAMGLEWVAVRLEGEEWMGLERMLFGARVAGVESRIGIDPFEYGLMERCLFGSVVQIIFYRVSKDLYVLPIGEPRVVK